VFEQVPDRIRTDILPLQSYLTKPSRCLEIFIYSKTGIYFPEKKKYLIEGRLAKRMQLLNVTRFEDYLQLLEYGQQRESEFELLCNTVTINETSFFRNEAQMNAFQQETYRGNH